MKFSVSTRNRTFSVEFSYTGKRATSVFQDRIDRERLAFDVQDQIHERLLDANRAVLR